MLQRPIIILWLPTKYLIYHFVISKWVVYHNTIMIEQQKVSLNTWIVCFGLVNIEIRIHAVPGWEIYHFMEPGIDKENWQGKMRPLWVARSDCFESANRIRHVRWSLKMSRHGLKPGRHEAEAFSMLEAEALTNFSSEAEAEALTPEKPKPENVWQKLPITKYIISLALWWIKSLWSAGQIIWLVAWSFHATWLDCSLSLYARS